MRWIVTFLDILVFLLFGNLVYKDVIWRDVFLEYIHSEYAEKFSENGVDVALFVNVNPYIQFLKPPDCSYDVFIKKNGDSSYSKLTGGSFGRGKFGTDGCSKGNMIVPRVWVFHTKNGSNFIGIHREEQYHYNETTFELFLEINKPDHPVLVLKPTPKIKNSSTDTTYTDEELVKRHTENVIKVDCKLYTFNRENESENYKQKNIIKQNAKSFFSDSSNIFDLYDVFSQLHLSPECIHSLAIFAKNDQSSIETPNAPFNYYCEDFQCIFW